MLRRPVRAAVGGYTGQRELGPLALANDRGLCCEELENGRRRETEAAPGGSDVQAVDVY